VSKAPLELVFSDVWGPAPNSVGKNNYYVSFIDDYSKFTWIFLLKNKSEVFPKFHDFRHHVKIVFPFSTLHPNVGAQLKAWISLLLPTLHTPRGDESVVEPTVTNVANDIHEVIAELGDYSTSNNDCVPADPTIAEDPGMGSGGDSIQEESTLDCKLITTMIRQYSHIVPFYCSNRSNLTCRYSGHASY
jgi:hypothetical protein